MQGLIDLAALAGFVMLGAAWFVVLPRVFWLYASTPRERAWCLAFWLFWTIVLFRHPVGWLATMIASN